MMKNKWIAVLTAAALICSSVVPAQAGVVELPEDPVTEATGDAEEPVLGEIQDAYGDDVSEEYVEGEALVKLSGGSPVAAAAELPIELETLFSVDTAAATAGDAAPASETGGGEIALASSDVLSTEELVDALSGYPGVEYAEPNYIYQLQSTDDPLFDAQWHLQDQTDVPGGTNVNAVWNETAGSEDLVVAVIDSGVDYTHPDLAPAIWRDSDGNPGRNFMDEGDPGDPMDLVGHGTHVAGIIGARGNNGLGTSGVNQRVKIMPLRIGGADGAPSDQAIRAFAYMVEQKTAGVNLVAANCSFGGPLPSRCMAEAIKAAGECGIITVNSSGNVAADLELHAYNPRSEDPSVNLVVNSCTADGTASAFSNFGRINSDLYAPGSDILSTYWLGEGGTYGPENVVCDLLAASPEVEPATLGENDAVRIDGLTWSVTPRTAGNIYGVILKFGDLSEYAGRSAFLGSLFKSLDAAGQEAKGAIGAYVYTTQSLWYMDVYLDGMPYARSLPSLQNGGDEIRWDDFSVLISLQADEQDIGRTFHYELGQLDLVSEAQHGYGRKSGTSMAAPVVTGAVALLADYYDVEKMEDPAKQAEAMREIRARIAGGVTRTEEMEERCASGGYLNLEKAITDPYPVLDTLSQEGSSAEIEGYFFGDEPGTLTMDGTPIAVTEWTDGRIAFTLPEGTTADFHEFRVTAAGDSRQYGCDVFLLDAPSGEEDEAYFEELPAPDLEKLGVESYDHSPFAKMAAYGGKLYVVSGEFYRSEGGRIHPVVLIYDEAAQRWDSMTLDYISFEKTEYILDMAESDGCLYFVLYEDTKDPRLLSVWRQDLLTGKHKRILKEKALQEYSPGNSVCDGDSIWIEKNEGGFLKLDLRDGSLEDSGVSFAGDPSSVCALEYVDGRIVMMSGAADDGQRAVLAEIIESGNGQPAGTGAKLPVYDNQSFLPATASYDGRVILAGLYRDKEHSADTYILDTKTNTWSEAPWKLAKSKVDYACGVVDGEDFYVWGNTQLHNKTEIALYRQKVRDLAVPEPDAAAKAASELAGGLRVKWSGGKLAVSWGKVSGAAGYDVFVEKCGKAMNAKDLVKTVKKPNTVSASISKLKGKAFSKTGNYKVRVKAYRMEDGEKTYVAESDVLHIAGKQNKRLTNAKKVSVDRASHILKPGQTAVISAKVTGVDSRKKLLPESHGKRIRYWSTNPEIASVNAKGEITAKQTGTCTIYAAAINGVRAKINTTVR